MDLDDEREGRDQPRALFVFQRGRRQSADRALASDGPKDSIVFARETGEFVCNLATYDLRAEMVASSFGFPARCQRDDRGWAGAGALASGARAAGRALPLCARMQAVADCEPRPARRKSLQPPRGIRAGGGVHIDERFIKDGRLDTAAMAPMARCGYADYAVVHEVMAIARTRARRRRLRTEGSGRGVTRSGGVPPPFSLRAVCRCAGRAPCTVTPSGCSRAARRTLSPSPLTGA